MATAFLCDKCKTFIKGTKSASVIDSDKIVRKELCGNCTIELYEWFRNENNSQK